MDREKKIHHFYRAANRNPPKYKWFQSHQERRGDPDSSLPPHVREAWDGCSAFDSEDGARRAALEQPSLGHLILRFDIPEGAGITWTPSGPAGHFDLRGGADLLKQFLSKDYEAKV